MTLSNHLLLILNKHLDQPIIFTAKASVSVNKKKMCLIDRDIPQMGVNGFVVKILCPCRFKNSAALDQSERGKGREGREGSGWVATVALVRTKLHSRGSPGDKSPATRINNNN